MTISTATRMAIPAEACDAVVGGVAFPGVTSWSNTVVQTLPENFALISSRLLMASDHSGLKLSLSTEAMYSTARRAFASSCVLSVLCTASATRPRASARTLTLRLRTVSMVSSMSSIEMSSSTRVRKPLSLLGSPAKTRSSAARRTRESCDMICARSWSTPRLSIAQAGRACRSRMASTTVRRARSSEVSV